jgi:hypothetical protein
MRQTNSLPLPSATVNTHGMGKEKEERIAGWTDRCYKRRLKSEVEK